MTCRTVTFPPSGSRWLQKTIKARRSLCVLQFLGVYSIKVSYNQRVVCVLQWVSKLGVNWKYIIIFHYTYFLGAFVFVDIFSSVKCVKVEKHCLTESSYSHMYYTQNMIQNSFRKTSRDNTLRQHNITHTHHTHQVNSAARTTTNILINWIFFFFFL